MADEKAPEETDDPQTYLDDIDADGLADDEWSVRVACIEGLKRLGRIEAIEPLQSYAEDVHPVVRNAVRAALAALTDSKTV